MAEKQFSLKQWALAYAKKGLAVFPVCAWGNTKEDFKKPLTKNGCRDATTNISQINKWWGKYPSANIGIATGSISGGLFVIDLDVDVEQGVDGRDTLKEWEKQHGKIPDDTWVSITGRGGYHIFFKDSSKVRNRTGLLEGIDIRGEGGYIVAPPSLHFNGRRYEWEQSPEEFDLMASPSIVFELLNQFPENGERKSFELPETIPDGQRTDYMVRMVCSMQAKGASDETIKVAVRTENEIKCNPPLSDKELEREVFPALKRYVKGTSSYAEQKNNGMISQIISELKPELNYTWDDKGNGQLFADVFKDRCRYNVTAKEWYRYNGRNWEEDTGAMEVSRQAKELSEALLSYSFTIDEGKKDGYRKHIIRLGQLRYRRTMVEDARDRYYITSDDLDQDLYLFNCQNGVIDLRTFQFREHNPDDLLSKISNVVYEPGVRSQDFEKFYDEVMMGDTEKKEYLQKLLGYSLTGDTREESAYFLYGATTRNGKGTLMGTYDYMLGSTEGYAMNILPETLAQKKVKDSRQASGDIARLKSCRFLNMSEPPKRMMFDVALFKTLLGRDPITARHLREREFEFLPVFKLFINTNFLPVITDDTVFTSGRINVITFDKHFKENERDKGLKNRLRKQQNISGFFNWCLEGLKNFYKDGAIPPATVTAATDEYRSLSDKVGNFIQECLEESEKNCKAKDVYDTYKTWCAVYGYGSENKGNFFAELKGKGLLSENGTVNRVNYKNVVKGYEIGKWQSVNYDFNDVG